MCSHTRIVKLTTITIISKHTLTKAMITLSLYSSFALYKNEIASRIERLMNMKIKKIVVEILYLRMVLDLFRWKKTKSNEYPSWSIEAATIKKIPRLQTMTRLMKNSWNENLPIFISLKISFGKM